MKKQKDYFRFTLVISVMLGIILPLVLGVKDPVYIAISFSLVWFLYVIIMWIFIFIVEGKRKVKEPKTARETELFPFHDIQELEAFWKITFGKHKEPGLGNPDWN